MIQAELQGQSSTTPAGVASSLQFQLTEALSQLQDDQAHGAEAEARADISSAENVLGVSPCMPDFHRCEDRWSTFLHINLIA